MLDRANIGCGRTPTDGWLNFDSSMSVRLARSMVFSLLNKIRLIDEESAKFRGVVIEKNIKWANACKHIPVPAGSLGVVYASHMLEHLDSTEARQFLAEAHRVLMSGGILRLAVPDLARRIEKYVQERDADDFMASLNMRSHNLHTIKGKIRMLALGDRDHRWMYDGNSLIKLLRSSGFIDPKEMPPGETTIPCSEPLNLREREDESIYVEATRP
jgi:SAM-dependent methyltransferase